MNMEGILYNTVRDMNFMFLFPSINVSSSFPAYLRVVLGNIWQVILLQNSKPSPVTLEKRRRHSAAAPSGVPLYQQQPPLERLSMVPSLET